MTLSRRGLITGFVSLLAAPAIVRAGSLMPVRVWTPAAIPAGFGLRITTAHGLRNGDIVVIDGLPTWLGMERAEAVRFTVTGVLDETVYVQPVA